MDPTPSERRPDARDPALAYQWVIFGILTFSHFLMAMFFFGWGPLAPVLKGQLQMDNRQLGFIVSAMYGAMMIVSVPAGFLVDRYGARIMLILSVSIVGAATILLSLAAGYPLVFLAAATGGTGYGMINQITTKGLMYWFEPSRRGTIMGVKQTGVTVGGSLMGLYVPFCARLFGWERGVLALGVALLVVSLLSGFFYRETPDRSFDLPMDEGESRSKGGLRLLLLRPLMVALALLFTLYAACQSCVVAFLVVYTEEAFDLPHVIAGSLLTAALVAGTLSRILFGWVSDRLLKGDRVAPMAILALIGVIALLSLTLLNAGPPLWALYLVAVLLGTSLTGWNALAITLVAEIAGHGLVGSIMGIVFTIAWGGMVLAPPVFGWIVDGHGYQLAWSLLTLLIAVSCVGFTAIWMRQRRESSRRRTG